MKWMRIRNPAARIQIRFVADQWHFGADTYVWLTDLDSTPDPTPFFSDLKNENFFFFVFLSYSLPAGTLALVLIKYFAKILL